MCRPIKIGAKGLNESMGGTSILCCLNDRFNKVTAAFIKFFPKLAFDLP